MEYENNEKNNEVVENENNGCLIKDYKDFSVQIMNDMDKYIQPVLYMKKAIPANSVINEKNGTEFLHVSPLVSSSSINICNTLANLQSTKFTDSFGVSPAYSLGYNQANITSDEVVNYIVQNVTISFCNMIDNCGDLFKAMVLNTRIKSTVYEALVTSADFNEDISIRTFIHNFITRKGESSYAAVMSNDSFYNKDKSDQEIFAQFKRYQDTITSQLEQLIYFKLCKACDKAISEILLGIKISPNQKYVVDAGIKYFKLDSKNISNVDIRYEVYYRLNLELVDMLNKFMVAVVVPMSSNLIKHILYLMQFFVYDVIGDTNRAIEVEKLRAKREAAGDPIPRPIEEVPVEFYDEF